MKVAKKKMAKRTFNGSIPKLDSWALLRNGTIFGIISNHHTIPDGDRITTSPIMSDCRMEEGSIVTTIKGSNYKLGTKLVVKREFLEKKHRHEKQREGDLKDEKALGMPGVLDTSSSPAILKKEKVLSRRWSKQDASGLLDCSTSSKMATYFERKSSVAKSNGEDVFFDEEAPGETPLTKGEEEGEESELGKNENGGDTDDRFFDDDDNESIDVPTPLKSDPSNGNSVNNGSSGILRRSTLSIVTPSSNESGDNMKNNEKPLSFVTTPNTIPTKPTPTNGHDANVPHELLEYPPLYFLLRNFPSGLKAIKKLYRARWSASYPLQRRIPFSFRLRKLGIVLTYGELFMLLPFLAIFIFGIITSFVNPDVSHSGHVSRLPLAIAILTANHNSVVTLLLGIPFERCLKYHKLAGRLAFLNGVFHTYAAFAHPYFIKNTVDHDNEDIIPPSETARIGSGDENVDNLFGGESNNVEPTLIAPVHSYEGSDPNFFQFTYDGTINSSGTTILILILSILITAAPTVRRVCFEIFFYAHIAFVVAMVVCAFFHSGSFVVIIACVFYGGDLLMRKIIMAYWTYPRKATIVNLTSDVVELTFPKTKRFDYNPGQYVYLAIPELSIFQWHPFSLSSSPHQDEVTLHIRKRGRWTKALHALAKEKHDVSILMEGPYGSVGVDLISNRYKMVMLLSGGIGVTPMQSICHQLMHEYESGVRELKKVWFVWTARDPAILDNMEVTRKNSFRYLDPEDLDELEEELDRKEKEEGLVQGGDVGSRGLPRNKSHGNLALKVLTQLPASYARDEELEEQFGLSEFEDDEEGGRCNQGTVLEDDNDEDDDDDDDIDEFYDDGKKKVNKDEHDSDSGKDFGNFVTLDDSDPELGNVSSSKKIEFSSDTLTTSTVTSGMERSRSGSQGTETILEERKQENDGGQEGTSSSLSENNDDENESEVQDEKDEKKIDAEPKPRPAFHRSLSRASSKPSLSREFSMKRDEDDILDLEFFLTSREGNKRSDGALFPFISKGRPDLKEMFAKMREEAVKQNEKRVAICVCAPLRLVDICRKASVKFSNKDVRFDFHSEVFE